MKNSLFKRAMAVASAVPLALTQCLGVANAVDVKDTASTARLTAESVTLNDGSSSALFYIEPNENNEKYTVNEENGSYTFTKDSVWYSDVYSILAQIGNGDKTSGTIDASALYAPALNRAGRYRDIAEQVVDCIGEMTYNVDAEGNVTIKGDADNVTSVLDEMVQKMAGDSLKNFADKYDMPELAEVKLFEGLEIAGSIEIYVNSATLNSKTSTSATVTFTDKVTGEKYQGVAIRDYIKAQLDAIETTVKKTTKDLIEKYDLDDAQYADVKAEIDRVESKITNKVNFAKTKLEASDKYVDKAMNYSATKSADSIGEIIEFVNSKIPVIESKIENVSEKAADKIENIRNGRTIPTSGAAIAANANVQKAYNEIMNTVLSASPVAIDIDVADWGELADSFTDITASVDNGVATFTAQLPDKEETVAKAYIESAYPVKVTDIHKEIEVEVNFKEVEATGKVSFAMNLKRVVLAEEEIPETSTSTNTSTTTNTETTPTGSETGTATETTPTGSETGTATETTPTGSETGTATETTPTGSETGTATETTPTGSETGTATETTPTGSETGTATETTPTGSETGTATETTPTGTETTPTDTTPTGTGIVTTTTAVHKTVVNFKTESEVGFYLNTDDEFNKDQLTKLEYSIDDSILYYDGEGNLLGQDVLNPGGKVAILDSVEFKDVPGDVFEINNKNTVNQFATQVPVYATKDIIAEDGTVIAKAGDVLKNVDGSKVSVTAYIGIKGDANLDMKADTEDTSVALAWYGKMQSGGVAAQTQFTNNNMLLQYDPMLDELAAFLCDVDNENDSQNWKYRKPARTIGSDDGSFIMAYFAKVMTGETAGKALWNDVLGEWAKK